MPAPNATTDNYSITEDQLLVGSANGFLINDSDPDGDPLSIILIDGRPFSFGTPITLASGAKLTINADGSFQYDQNGAFAHLNAGQTVNDIFTYTISDGRLGFDTSAVCVTISGVTQNQNQPLIINGAITGVVEEETGLPGGNEDTTDLNGFDADESGLNTVTNASAGSLASLITGGVEGTLSFAFAPLGGNPAVQTVSNGLLTSDGRQVYFDTEGPNLFGYYNANGDSSDYDAATDTKVFTITLASTGAYTFTLLAPVDQPIGGEDSIAINLNGRVTVTDSGGPGADTNVPLNASITVIDDTPLIGTPTAALAGELTLDETRPVGTETDGDSAPAGLATVTANFADNFAAASPSYGADGAGSTSLAFELSSEGLGSGLYALDNTDTTTGVTGTAVLPDIGPTWHVAAAADFNGDGKSDILWQHDSGLPAMWTMDGTTLTGAVLLPDPGPTWHVAAAADFNGDGKSDILWQHDSGLPAMWTMDGTTLTGAVLLPDIGPTWHVAAAADFNGDGKSDILWQHDSGLPAMWTMDGTTLTGAVLLPDPGPTWHVAAAADFNGDGKSDILWQHDSGLPAMWTMDGATLTGAVYLPNIGPTWHVAAAADFNGDGKSDILWQHDGGLPAIWTMDGTTLTWAGYLPNPGPTSHVAAAADFNGDGKSDILWQHDSGLPEMWTMGGTTLTGGIGQIGQGDEILLYVSPDGTTVTGSTAATEAGITAANTYFTIEVDNDPLSPTFGQVTFAQTQNIWHDDTSDSDDPEVLTTDLAGDLKLTQTVTDADGDTASASINLGAGVFVIQDDGPNAVVANATADTLVLDETRPVGSEEDGDSAPAGLATVTANFADNFAAVTDFGSDGPGSASLSLVLTGSNVASGLFALGANGAQGASIVLNQAAPGADIIGTVGAVEYFRISIDPATGVVTFSQSTNVWHANTLSDDDTSTLTLTNPADLQVVQTVTDADGDKDTAGINLGAGVFQIEDDGPSAVVANATPDTLVLDETRPVGSEEDGDSAPAGLATVTANFADNFAAVDVGSDGPGTTGFSLVLTGSDVASGLFALGANGAPGASIVLNQAAPGADIIGTVGGVGGTEYFRISIDAATGVVTFSQSTNVWHANTLSDDDTSTLTLANAADLQVVVTDADGDKATAGINLGAGVFQIEDDGPAVSGAVSSGTVDEDGVVEDIADAGPGDGILGGPDDFVDPNTDGDNDESTTAGTVANLFQSGADEPLTYSLSTDTSSLTAQGLKSGGVDLTYTVVGNLLTAEAGAGNTVFTFTLIGGTGAWTFNLEDQLDHPSQDGVVGLDNTENELTILLGSLIQAADGDGDTVTATGTAVQVVVDDDTPIRTAPISSGTVDEDGVLEGAADAGPGDGILGGGATDYIDTNLDGDNDESTVTGTIAGVAEFQSGADEPLTFSLVTDTSDLEAQNLKSGGVALTYSVVGNVLTAEAGAGNTVFTFKVNPDGTWTFDLEDQLDHVDDGTDTENDLTIFLGSLIQATDFDGDTAPGGAVQIVVNDDTPIAAVAPPAVSATVVEDALLTTAPGDTGDLSDGNLDAGQDNSDDEASGLAGSLTTLFEEGADEPLTYTLSTDTSDLPTLFSQGEALTYSVVGNVLTATAGVRTVFTLGVNADGSWTFDLDDQLDHVDASGDAGFNLITAADGSTSVPSIDFSSILVATDFDGDSVTGAASGSFTIAVENDVPIAAVAPPAVSATVVEDALLTTAPGDTGDLSDGNLDAGQDNSDDEASGLAGSLTTLFEEGADEPLTYTLSTDTSDLPTLFSQGEALTYSVVGNVLTATAGVRTVFTLGVNADGSWTFDLDDQLDHVDASGDAGFNLITAADGSTSVPSIDFSSILVATDFDGDSVTGAASGSFTIAVENDVPVSITPETATLNNAAGASITADLDDDVNVDDDVGADEPGTIAFANITNGQQAVGVIDGNAVNLTSGGENVELFLVDHDFDLATPLQLQGWTGGLGGTGTEIFEITLQPDGSLGTLNDTYQVELFADVGATVQRDVTNFSDLGSNSQNFKFLNVADTTQDLLFSGYQRSAGDVTDIPIGGEDVVASTVGIGVGNQSLDDGDNLRIDFVNDAIATGSNNNVYNYTTHYNINDFGFSIVQVNGSPPPNSIEVWVRIYDADDDDPPGVSTVDHAGALDDPLLQDQVTTITLNGTTSLAIDTDYGVLDTLTTVDGGRTFTTTPDGEGGYLITGLNLNDTIEVSAGTGYSRVEIENARSMTADPDPNLNGESFDIGAFSFASTSTNIPSVDMSFDVALTDADGDTVVSPDAIAVHLQEPPPVTNADTVITNVGANAAVAIPTAWLLANDEGSTLSVTGVGGAIGGSVSGPTGGNVTFTDDATLDGSFTYQANNGSVSGNAATVTINNNTTATTTLIGGANSEIIIGGSTNDTIRGGAGDDFINGGAGSDVLDLSDASGGIIVTLVQSPTDTVIDLFDVGLGTDTYRNIEGVIATTFADTVKIDAGSLTGRTWTVNVGSDAIQDTIILNHNSIGPNFIDPSDNTLVSINNFNEANDRIAVTLGVGGSSVTGGGFQTISGPAANVGVANGIIEITAAPSADLTADGNNGAIETIIANATNDFAATGSYTVIVYSSTDASTANAGIYTVNIIDDTNPGSNGMTVEHVMTLNGVGFGALDSANFTSLTVADPIVLDLGEPGLNFSSGANGVQFDINADGAADQVAWTEGDDGILALDLDNSGTIDNGTEMFTPYFAGGNHASGVAALATLDDNADSMIDSSDASFGDLRVWQDLNHDGISDAGELASLEDHGIAGIDLNATPSDAEIDGQAVLSQGSFSYADGTTGTFVEVALDTALGEADPSGSTVAGADTFVLNDLDCHDGTPALRDVIGDFLNDLDTHDRISALKDVIRDFLQKDSIDWDRGIIDEFESLVSQACVPTIDPGVFWHQDAANDPTAVQADTNDSRGAEIMFALTGVHNPNETDFIL